MRALLRCGCYALALRLSRNPTTVNAAPITPRFGWEQLRRGGDNNDGGGVVDILVANVGGMGIECGDGVGRGQGVFAAGREGATGRALVKRVAGAQQGRTLAWRLVMLTCGLSP